ncbi:MAG TPA: metal ABC transporter substrate-binding protein [Acidimicrobiales bacterium]|nr:metal ABC transporter substrate-binding protein [Acidimicrobiales bacterium]
MSLLTTACGDGDSSPSGADEISAVASVYPLAWVAEQVAPYADVMLLSAGGVEAHDLELTPDQREAIQVSDVVLFVGKIGYQPQVEQAVTSAEGTVVSLSDVAGPARLREPGDDAHGAGPAQGGDAVVDPHIWFDSKVMADAAVHAGEAFAAADPGNAATYLGRAEALVADFADLGRELDANLGGECTHGEAIVSHQAYGYLLEPHGIEQHGVTGINPEAGAASGELADLVEEIEGRGFTHVLSEPVEGREGAETVAREAGVELLEILPLDAVTDDQAELGFIRLVRDQAGRFAVALGC